MILEVISVVIFSLYCFLFAEDFSDKNYELIFKTPPSEVTVKYIRPYYKNAKLMFDKIDSIYNVKFCKLGVLEEMRGKNLYNIDYLKRYRYISDINEIKNYCDDTVRNYQKDEIEKICFSAIKDKKIKLVLIEMIDDAVFRTNFEMTYKDGMKRYVFDSNLELEEIVELKEKNSMKEEMHYDASRVLRKKITEKKKRFFDEISIYENDILKRKVLKEYRTDNTLRKETISYYMPDGSISSKVVSEYDTKGFKDLECYYDSNLNLYRKIKYEHEFDEKGNWIKLIKYDITNGKKVFSVIVRELKY